MTYAPYNRSGHIFDGRPMRQIQAKWSRLSMSDLAQITTKDQLIATVEERYGLPIGVAARDVEIWRLDRHH
jgi:hypothetical protein